VDLDGDITQLRHRLGKRVDKSVVIRELVALLHEDPGAVRAGSDADWLTVRRAVVIPSTVGLWSGGTVTGGAPGGGPDPVRFWYPNDANEGRRMGDRCGGSVDAKAQGAVNGD